MCNESKYESHLELKTLLSEWNLPQLLQHFMAQNITLDILKMMKFHHINYALNGFTLGDRIRFEYELEIWRRKLGIPLEYKEISIKSQNTISQTEKEDIGFKSREKLEEPSRTRTPTPPPQSPIHKNSVAKPASTSTPTQRPQFKLPVRKTFVGNPTSIKALKTAPLLHTQLLPIAKISKNSTTPKFTPPKDLIARAKTLDVRSILMQSPPRGPELLQIYKDHQSFTDVERSDLISLLANFFYCNSIHLTLKMSHDLEREILKIFPNERLGDYRKEKRGRIYIRLCNIKNFKQRCKKAENKNNYDLQQFVITKSQEDDDQNCFVADEAEVLMDDENNSNDILSNYQTNNETEAQINDETNSHDLLSTISIKTEAHDDVQGHEVVNQNYFE